MNPTLDTTVALRVAKTCPMPTGHLEHLTALLGAGLRLDVKSTTLTEMVNLFAALNYRSYCSTFTIDDGAYAIRLVGYLPMPAQLTPALDERFTYVQGNAPTRLTRDGWVGIDKRSACWSVAQWAQTATKSEVTCLAALLTSCPSVPLGQLLKTSTAVAV